MEILQYIEEMNLVIAPVLIILGMFLKQLNHIKDKYIPVILTIIGIFLCAGVNQELSIEVIIQGTLISGLAVLGNQIPKQLKKDE